jgi:hypothetical protein
MNIAGLTQLQIEQEFDNQKLHEELNKEIAEFAETVYSYIPQFHEMLSAREIVAEDLEIMEVIIILLSILGNDKSGIPVKGHTASTRDIPLETVIKTMYLDREFNKMFQEESLNVAMDVIAEFDGIFYDIVKSVKRMEDGQFATFTYLRSEILFSENLNLRATYNRFRLPLIECPDDWTEKSRGGYKLTKRKCTTGRGSEKQPQLVLDALNKLQKQSWIHSQDEELELNYSYDKFLSEGNSDRMSRKKANDLLLSTEETYATMEEIPMHFEYRFDFRGRIYSTGYDINPQGNTIKKGGLIPNFE